MKLRNMLILGVCCTALAIWVFRPTTNDLVKKARAAHTAKDYQTALTYYTKAAERGDLIAQSTLGGLYSFGFGIKHNHKESLKWLTKAAERGDLSAMNNLGNLLAKGGEDVPKDIPGAIKWYEKCNERSACYNSLGHLYLGSRGSPVNFPKAIEVFKAGAARESTNSKTKMIDEGDRINSEMAIANIYVEGRYVEKNCDEARRWLNRSAIRGETGHNAELAQRRLRELNEPDSIWCPPK